MPRLVQLLAEWTDKFPYDFRDERVMVHVREITHQCVSVEPAVRHQVSAMLQTLLHRLTALDKYETFLQQTGTDATVGSFDALSPVSNLAVNIVLYCFTYFKIGIFLSRGRSVYYVDDTLSKSVLIMNMLVPSTITYNRSYV